MPRTAAPQRTALGSQRVVKKTVGVPLTAADHRLLELHAHRTGVSMAEQIRTLLAPLLRDLRQRSPHPGRNLS